MTYGLEMIRSDGDLPRWNFENHTLESFNKDPITEIEKNPELKGLSKREWVFTGFHSEDGSFSISQYTCEFNGDTLLNFGPISATLETLLWKGYYLSIDGFRYNRKVKLKLVHDRLKENYAIYSAPLEIFLKETDLSVFIRQTKNYLLRKSELKETKKIVVSENPFDQLKKKYPFKKPEIKIGNQTVDEYVRQQLKSMG